MQNSGLAGHSGAVERQQMFLTESLGLQTPAPVESTMNLPAPQTRNDTLESQVLLPSFLSYTCVYLDETEFPWRRLSLLGLKWKCSDEPWPRLVGSLEALMCAWTRAALQLAPGLALLCSVPAGTSAHPRRGAGMPGRQNKLSCLCPSQAGLQSWDSSAMPRAGTGARPFLHQQSPCKCVNVTAKMCNYDSK